ncbi:CHAT domain-containing protein [Flavobacterium humi]|uniref:CHAT domain-containing protein n=2 Tax=Flavobacterium humi TaxID=2562683 RepID=A0A4Z0LBE4_9FLAO|nr:CHAT domain-containing protein [Flavobacterium humi]
MSRKLLWLFLCAAPMVFGQNPSGMEGKIYNAVDVFVAGPNPESLRRLSEAEKAFHPKTKPEILAFVILKCNKAYFENQFGQATEAITSYESAWHLFQKNKLKGYDITEYCLKPLGNLYTVIGDYDNAENTIKQYFFIANLEKDQPQKWAAILNLSNVYQSSGKNDLAITLLEKTIQTEKLTVVQKGILLNNLGANYMISGHSGQAKVTLQTCISLLKDNKTEAGTVSNASRNLAFLYSRERDFSKAGLYFEMSKKGFLESKNPEPRITARFYYDEAQLLFEQGKYAKAGQSITAVFKTLIPGYAARKKLLPNQNDLYTETVLMDALDLQGELFSVQGQPEQALACYTLSFHIEALFQSLLVYENSKIIAQIRKRNRTEKCLSLYYLLYQKEKKIVYIEKAFQLQEQTKSSVLKEAVSASRVISKEEKQLAEQLQNCSNSILKEQQKLELADISKINQAIKKQNELMLLLKSKQVKNNNPFHKDIEFPALFEKLKDENAQMMAFFWGTKNLYSFTLENGNINWSQMNLENGLRSRVHLFLSYFNDSNAILNDPKGFNRLSNSLYASFRFPPKGKNRNLILIPDGILSFLPFETLITRQSTGHDFSRWHYLLDDFTVSYNNSVSFYLNSRPFANTEESVLGVFPVFENSAAELPFSKAEMRDVKKRFKGRYLEKSQATFANFKANAAHYSMLHLSTHAAAGDIFTPASIRFYDQEILYSELYHLDIHPDLVVLSACETGIGKLYKAEGAMSVARGFQFGGARNLLFSLWKVNDYSTAVFMDYFYRNVEKHHSYPEANHKAKSDYLQDPSISNAKKSPYYWGAMVYYGTLEPKTSNHYFRYAGLAVLIGLALFLLFKKIKHGRIRKSPQKT